MKKLSILFFIPSCMDFSPTTTESGFIDQNENAQGPTIGSILKPTRTCTQLENTAKFKSDSGENYNFIIPICKIPGALWWRADADIFKDEQTNTKTSLGNNLSSAEIPFFTIPYPSNGFNATHHKILAGKGKASVGIIAFEDRFIYAVFGDFQGNGVIGDISIKAAKMLQIPPEGVDGGVTYIVFTDENYVFPAENYEKVIELANFLTGKMIAN